MSPPHRNAGPQAGNVHRRGRSGARAGWRGERADVPRHPPLKDLCGRPRSVAAPTRGDARPSPELPLSRDERRDLRRARRLRSLLGRLRLGPPLRPPRRPGHLPGLRSLTASERLLPRRRRLGRREGLASGWQARAGRAAAFGGGDLRLRVEKDKRGRRPVCMQRGEEVPQRRDGLGQALCSRPQLWKGGAGAVIAAVRGRRRRSGRRVGQAAVPPRSRPREGVSRGDEQAEEQAEEAEGEEGRRKFEGARGEAVDESDEL